MRNSGGDKLKLSDGFCDCLKGNNIMIEQFLSPIAKELWIMLDHPEEWMFDSFSFDPYTIVHKDTHICLWISNGRFFLDGYNTTIYGKDEKGYTTRIFQTKKVSIGVLDRHILWNKVSKVVDYLNRTPDSIIGELKSYNEKRNEI